MKKQSPYWKMSACFAAAALTLIGSVSAVRAADPAVTASLTLRPLTPTEIKTYGLTNPPAQVSAGLSTVGLGEPVYVDAMVNAAIAPSNIVVVTWSLTNKPAGSTAALSAGLLGTNVPLYKMADRYNQAGTPAFQLAGRTFFRPDVVGSYTVTASITVKGTNGVTTTTTNLSTKVTGATYLGITACAACHSGAFIGVPVIYPSYTNTLHASFFARAIDGNVSSHYSKSCISCHTVGYDTNSFANNGGFDDVAAVLGWTFPTVLTNGNWANMPEQLKDVANIQCENCHGPGSQHMFSSGVVGNTNAISVTYNAADCGQCHDSLTGHFKNAEWNNSIHARATRTPSGAGRAACARCHTGGGFAGYMDTVNAGTTYTTNNADTTYTAITCQTCHNPHDATNPHQLRAGSSVLLADGFTVVTNAGLGTICMNCHRSRNGSVSNSIVQYPLLQQTWAGGSSFGPHDNPASDMLEGVNGWTYGQVIPSSAHRFAVTNTCVGCHMQTVAATDPAFLQAGGHTFNMTYTNSGGALLDNVAVCIQCHGPTPSFDMVKVDYNGDGVIEGVQTEVQHLLDKLSTLLPNSTYQANVANYVADGLVKSPSTKTNWPAKYLQAAYNFQFVNNDLSKGVHNAAYAVGLLKASIGNLTGDANNDGLPDSWQINYFGSGFATNPAAAYSAVNNPSGVPNWMMYALGLAPNAGFTVAGSGVIYFNGDNIVNGAPNTIAIYTAAEVVFDTVVGTTYQIQGINALTGSWQNISTNIVGTGSSISYVTPTRGTTQMFFRVVHTP
jgi:hypothetical protein